MNQNSLNSALSLQRREWFTEAMRKRINDFTTYKELSLFAGTWNVNGRSPDTDLDLAPWIFPKGRRRNNSFDVYMIGLQEVQSLSGMDAVRSDTMRGFEWRDKIHQLLSDEYEKVTERQLVGIMILVFVRKNHSGYLSNIQTSAAATGFLSAVGNKGGIAVRFKLYDRTVSCVSCHLSAHTGNVERRNQDFRDVVRKAVFDQLESDCRDDLKHLSPPDARSNEVNTISNHASPHVHDLHSANQAPSSIPMNGEAPSAWFENMKYVRSIAVSAFSELGNPSNSPSLLLSTGIFEHDVVFWLGDLNYRMNAPPDKVMTWIRTKDWQALYNADELQHQLKQSALFMGLKEGPICFPPTYKLRLYDDEYATDENGELKRVPAYTDRILWKTGVDDKGKERQVNLKEYNWAKVYSSDHRPVYARFGMTFGIEDKTRKLHVQTEVNRILDLKEAKYIPQLGINPSPVRIGEVTFQTKCELTVTLQNLSELGTAYVSIEATSSLPEWLHFDSSRWRNVIISPGGFVLLHLSVQVGAENGLARRISTDGCILNAALDISIEPGRIRKRLEMTGRYIPTCLGLPLELLSMMPYPVRALGYRKNRGALEMAREGHAQQMELENKNHPNAVPLAVPKEIWLLVDALLRTHRLDMENSVNRVPGLFFRQGDNNQVLRILSCVDNGDIIPNSFDGYAIASCFAKVLKSLEETVIPKFAVRRCIEAGGTGDPLVVHALTQFLPPVNVNVFWYVIGLLCELLKSEELSSMQKLAEVFAEVLFPQGNPGNSKDLRSKAAFIIAAMNFRQQLQPSNYEAVIDLKRPSLHPRNIKAFPNRSTLFEQGDR